MAVAPGSEAALLWADDIKGSLVSSSGTSGTLSGVSLGPSSGSTARFPAENRNLVVMSQETEKVEKPDFEWRAELTPEQYHVLREKGTEPAWTGALLDEHDPGLFRCAACGAELFRSDDKFDSGSGWPSFTKAAAEGVIVEHADNSHGMIRTEIDCARCGGHLGHVFPDGPNPTGLRYCINSVSLEFDPDKSGSEA
jgi:peptide-methionine (R)-S-oxide reductase